MATAEVLRSFRAKYYCTYRRKKANFLTAAQAAGGGVVSFDLAFFIKTFGCEAKDCRLWTKLSNVLHYGKSLHAVWCSDRPPPFGFKG